tara:strand:- start:3654 stop:4130 length:477 start_codon:yes stop_codon:yes gene_type:complete
MTQITFDPETLAPIINSEPTSEAQSLELHQRGILSGLGGTRIANIPIGDALIGGASATLVTELVSGFTGQSGVMSALIKLVAGNLLAGAFSGILGKGATDSTRLFITYDAIRDLIPLDAWVQQIMGGVGVSQSQPVAEVPYTGNGSVIAIDEWLRSAA